MPHYNKLLFNKPKKQSEKLEHSEESKHPHGLPELAIELIKIINLFTIRLFTLYLQQNPSTLSEPLIPLIQELSSNLFKMLSLETSIQGHCKSRSDIDSSLFSHAIRNMSRDSLVDLMKELDEYFKPDANPFKENKIVKTPEIPLKEKLYVGSNLYKILGVTPEATSTEIRKAFYRLALQYHPDKNKDPSAIKEYERIKNAYEILSNPSAKSDYDKLLAPKQLGFFSRPAICSAPVQQPKVEHLAAAFLLLTAANNNNQNISLSTAPRMQP